ncbi:ATP-binding protein [Neomegalonema sp.]|uniref:ATP-binding protein n=1 Tax=Neomegalonema sp. TaxID=2039713 RepID=UPI0026027297|nr:ATP-binding protein [Neomegalonema sp.]MDD2869163.1 ATP-binding protein [Neomegalonema sp.]
MTIEFGQADSLRRIAEALERISPAPAPAPDFAQATVWVWRGAGERLDPVTRVSRVPLARLVGIDRARDTLLANTRRFAEGLPANNALLWGARGMGKSALVKAIQADIEAERPGSLHLIEILREDLPTLGRLLSILREAPEHRFVMFCDDLSFDKDDAHYKALKAALDGGVEGRPPNALLYATSNRRHLMPRDMIDNERQTAIHPGEAVEEKVSLSDRFGLWLGFHPCGQDEYFAMIEGYAKAWAIPVTPEELRAEAVEWRQTRGAMSGRVAWQFIQDLAGRKGVRIDVEAPPAARGAVAAS